MPVSSDYILHDLDDQFCYTTGDHDFYGAKFPFAKYKQGDQKVYQNPNVEVSCNQAGCPAFEQRRDQNSETGTENHCDDGWPKRA